MRNKVASFVLFIYGILSAKPTMAQPHPTTSQTYTIEDTSLTRLQPKLILAIQQSSTFNHYEKLGCRLKGTPTDLCSSSTITSYFITTENGCGWGASLGPIWIVSGKNGTYRMLLYAGGYNMVVQSASHQGLKDIKIHVATAGQQSSKKYIFNGQSYVTQ